MQSSRRMGVISTGMTMLPRTEEMRAGSLSARPRRSAVRGCTMARPTGCISRSQGMVRRCSCTYMGPERPVNTTKGYSWASSGLERLDSELSSQLGMGSKPLASSTSEKTFTLPPGARKAGRPAAAALTCFSYSMVP